jgi:hypothetical protein
MFKVRREAANVMNFVNKFQLKNTTAQLHIQQNQISKPQDAEHHKEWVSYRFANQGNL